MQHFRLFTLLLILFLALPQYSPAQPDFYNIGEPVLIDVYVSPSGNDDNSGATRSEPLRTIGAAWSRIPEGALQGTGYRINLLPGSYECEGGCMNYFSDRQGTATFPVILQAADGPGTVTLQGGLNLANVQYFYVLNVTLSAGDPFPTFGNNVLHVERGDHLLFRGMNIQGPSHRRLPENYEIQEVIKINQSKHIYLEACDISGAYQTGVDYFAVQYGHILQNRIHDIGEWGMYLKGGSAYFHIEGNEIYDCGLGFQAGEGSNFEVMETPFLHYEAYDFKFVNNLLHHISGTGLSVSGGYNILLAHNTLYRVATFTDEAQGGERGYGLFSAVYGARSCLDFSENGEGNAQQVCGGLIDQGGWGTSAVGEGGEWIPNKNVFVYNNIFYNPQSVQSRYGHFVIRGPQTPPSIARNLPSPVRADDNLQIKGNIVWNGPANHPIGINEESGCQNNNPTCTLVQLTADNAFNTLEPQFVNAEQGNFAPTPGGNLTQFRTSSIPDFTWNDAPARPVVPVGVLDNEVSVDKEGRPRTSVNTPGAYIVIPAGVEGWRER